MSFAVNRFVNSWGGESKHTHGTDWDGIDLLNRDCSQQVMMPRLNMTIALETRWMKRNSCLICSKQLAFHNRVQCCSLCLAKQLPLQTMRFSIWQTKRCLQSCFWNLSHQTQNFDMQVMFVHVRRVSRGFKSNCIAQLFPTRRNWQIYKWATGKHEAWLIPAMGLSHPLHCKCIDFRGRWPSMFRLTSDLHGGTLPSESVSTLILRHRH